MVKKQTGIRKEFFQLSTDVCLDR